MLILTYSISMAVNTGQNVTYYDLPESSDPTPKYGVQINQPFLPTQIYTLQLN